MASELQNTTDGRRAAARRVLDGFLDAVEGSVAIDAEAIKKTHADLMPELEHELDKLELIRRARYARSTADPIRTLPVDAIPGYELLETIHCGGQGVVYQATQLSTRRTVAIKVMREGPFAGLRDRARFEREVRILGQLDHPNIVAIHDGGSIAGNTYFVMDYIPGLQLDEHVAETGLSVPATMALFADVCDAVNVAHLRGIIHRDLKPGNVRVDPEGRPRVLDFGLAKLSSCDLVADQPAAAVTGRGEFVGSLPWASPEQADGESIDIDTRSDVYSLGIIAYQLLTGRFPYDVAGALREVFENIASAEPVRPSTLRREIDDEVETIVLRCLSKDKTRRYETAGELARDVRRYLAGEPIEAKRDSRWYVFRKTVGRYRVAVGVAASFTMLMTAFAITLGVLYHRAGEAKQEAARQRDSAREVVAFMEQIFGEFDPENGGNGSLFVRDAVRDILDRQYGRAVRDLEEQPRALVELTESIAGVYENLGSHEPALACRRRALQLRRDELGDDDLALSEARLRLGTGLANAGRLHAGREQLEAALAVRRVRLGDRHSDTAATVFALAHVRHQLADDAGAENLFREALELRRRLFREPHADLIESLAGYGAFLQGRGDYDGAETLMREAVTLVDELHGDDHLSKSEVDLLFGGLLRETGRPTEAELYVRDAVDMARRLLPPDHPQLARGVGQLGRLLMEMGRLDEAEPLLLESLDVLTADRGPDDTRTQEAVLLVVDLYERWGAREQADRYRKQLEVASGEATDRPGD